MMYSYWSTQHPFFAMGHWAELQRSDGEGRFARSADPYRASPPRHAAPLWSGTPPESSRRKARSVRREVKVSSCYSVSFATCMYPCERRTKHNRESGGIRLLTDWPTAGDRRCILHPQNQVRQVQTKLAFFAGPY